MKINQYMKMFFPPEKLNSTAGKNENTKQKKDTIEISDTSKAFDKVNKFLNLGRPDRLDTSDLSPKEKEEFLQMLAKLIQKGIIGYEIREVNGKPEKQFIVNEIGDKRLYGTKLYNRPGFYDEK